jgi:hypothetical protein
MKYLKSYKKFFEDGGNATSNASTAGMGSVVSAQPGSLPGTFGSEGSGDIGFVLKTSDKRKKGKPHEISDLRDLEKEKLEKVKDI